MTCAHVVDLIDAGPFAEYPPEHLEAARAHARQCQTCGPALALSTTLTSELAALPEPETPADLAGIVMARIAQVTESDAVSAPGKQRTVSAVRRRDWMQTATTLGGLVAGLALIVSMPSGVDALGSFVTLRVGASALATLPSSGLATLAIAAGLMLYLVGLFAPIRAK